MLIVPIYFGYSLSTTVPLKNKDVLRYVLLALIVETTSGISFAGFLKRNAPLQMNNTVAYERDVFTVSKRAYGYTQRGKSFERTEQSLTSSVLGDGGIYSSVEDL